MKKLEHLLTRHLLIMVINVAWNLILKNIVLRRKRTERLLEENRKSYFYGVCGEYATPLGYFVDETAAEKFDKEFPYKEKLKLSGQLF